MGAQWGGGEEESAGTVGQAIRQTEENGRQTVRGGHGQTFRPGQTQTYRWKVNERQSETIRHRKERHQQLDTCDSVRSSQAQMDGGRQSSQWPLQERPSFLRWTSCDVPSLSWTLGGHEKGTGPLSQHQVLAWGLLKAQTHTHLPLPQ